MINQISRFFLHEYQVNNEGGKIFVDKKVAKWLDSFSTDNKNKKSSSEIKVYKQITKCGIDENLDILPPEKYPKISIILVLYNSRFWVENLISMFENLSPWLHEIIVVDNGSDDDGLFLLKESISRIIYIKNTSSKSFSAAINQGTRISTGEVFLIINPDVYIPKSSLWAMIDCYFKNPAIGAISPKLLLMRTPGFINGIGNIVKPFWHGYDLGLGHLDIGQFDEIVELPSACFAAILIPRNSWERVGELDEEYPMYYEDSDWCYRTRKLGLRIRFCKDSKVFHAFKSYKSRSEPLKGNFIKNIAYGRLRFVKKNLSTYSLPFFLFSFILSDILLLIRFWIIQRQFYISEFFWAWTRIINKNPKNIGNNESNRLIDMEIEKFKISFPLVKKGIPILNWKLLKIVIKNIK